jgi:hypothetical protein
MSTSTSGLDSRIDGLESRVTDLAQSVDQLQKQFRQTPAATPEHVDQRFKILAASWKAQSEFLSSLTSMAMLRPYQEIIGMGQTVLPLLFRELRDEPDYWFWALEAITGSDPIPPECRGDLDAMTQAWLQWGRERGYLM